MWQQDARVCPRRERDTSTHILSEKLDIQWQLGLTALDILANRMLIP